jgi:hypothetical protein
VEEASWRGMASSSAWGRRRRGRRWAGPYMGRPRDARAHGEVVELVSGARVSLRKEGRRGSLCASASCAARRNLDKNFVASTMMSSKNYVMNINFTKIQKKFFSRKTKFQKKIKNQNKKNISVNSAVRTSFHVTKRT